MTDLLCPLCSHIAPPAAHVDRIGLCAGCGASLVHETDGSWRRATNLDTATLSAGDLKMLQKARGAIARPERRQR